MCSSRTLAVSAGAASGGFTIWLCPGEQGSTELEMTGGLADGFGGGESKYFPRTRAPNFAALVEKLEDLPGWLSLPLFNPVTVDGAFFAELDRVFAARHPQIWDERRECWLAAVEGPLATTVPSQAAPSTTRRCGFCGGPLSHSGGWERSSEERAGNPSASDRFQCDQCGRRFSHNYEESFSGDEEWWNVWKNGRWAILPREKWPT